MFLYRHTYIRKIHERGGSKLCFYLCMDLALAYSDDRSSKHSQILAFLLTSYYLFLNLEVVQFRILLILNRSAFTSVPTSHKHSELPLDRPTREQSFGNYLVFVIRIIRNISSSNSHIFRRQGAILRESQYKVLQAPIRRIVLPRVMYWSLYCFVYNTLVPKHEAVVATYANRKCACVGKCVLLLCSIIFETS